MSSGLLGLLNKVSENAVVKQIEKILQNYKIKYWFDDGLIKFSAYNKNLDDETEGYIDYDDFVIEIWFDEYSWIYEFENLNDLLCHLHHVFQ